MSAIEDVDQVDRHCDKLQFTILNRSCTVLLYGEIIVIEGTSVFRICIILGRGIQCVPSCTMQCRFNQPTYYHKSTFQKIEARNAMMRQLGNERWNFVRCTNVLLVVDDRQDRCLAGTDKLAVYCKQYTVCGSFNRRKFTWLGDIQPLS